MSFLQVPSKIRDAFPILREAIMERYTACGYRVDETFYRFRPPYPFSNSGFRSVFETFRYHIKRLYAYAFPPENFGKWSDLRPNLYDWETASTGGDTPLLDAKISEVLQNAGIDPSGLFWEVPHRFCDGNYIRACYYLLNEKILHFMPGQIGRTCKARIIKYLNYDKGDHQIYEYDTPEDGLLISVAYGHLKQSMLSHHDPKFINTEAAYRPVVGNWKLRYRAELNTYMDAVNSGDEGVYVFDQYVGDGEVACYGNESEIFELMPESLKDKEYYRKWGDLRYRFVSRSERQTLTGVLVTKENFPPLKYKYLD